MIRLIRIVGAAMALMLALAAAAGGSPPRAQLRGFVCQRALDPASRAISVSSVMRPVSGTQEMAVRFALLSRIPGASSFTPVTGTDLGRWLSPSDPTLGRQPGDVWILNKPVVDLPAPAAYRFRVSFRWTGVHHRILATTVRHTATCLEPELRPDLAVRRVDVPQLGPKGTFDIYTVVVANDGETSAGAFTVELTAPGSRPVQSRVSRLPAHSSTVVRLRGPLCLPGAPPTVTVDPQDEVDDLNRANNVATISCTSPTSPSGAA